MQNDTQNKTDEAVLNLDKDAFIQILKRAASRERTVVEFRTKEKDEERVLDSAIDITDHVKSLEEDYE